MLEFPKSQEDHMKVRRTTEHALVSVGVKLETIVCSLSPYCLKTLEKKDVVSWSSHSYRPSRSDCISLRSNVTGSCKNHVQTKYGACPAKGTNNRHMSVAGATHWSVGSSP